MASTRSVTGRMFCGLVVALASCGCGDASGGDEIGETSSESESSESSGASTGSTESDSSESDSTDTVSIDTDSTSADSTSADSTDADSTSTDSTSTDSTDAGDPSCEDDSYIGVGLANDDWGLGDLCDEIWVCADDAQIPLVQAAVPDATCEPGQGCPGSHCTLSYQTIVDADVDAAVCDALLVPGIDEVYCVVYGP